MAVISLFEKWQTVHRHFVNDKDELHGLWTILLAARFGYRNEVTNGVKTHQRFVEDFACSHKHVNCNKVGCKNVHRRNHSIAKRILMERHDLAQHLFNSDAFTLEDCIKMKNIFDTTDAPPPNIMFHEDVSETKRSLSFDCHLTKEQMVRIAHCANTNHLFCVSEVSIDDMQSLLECKSNFSLKVENTRNVAVLFNALLEGNLIGWNWKKAMENGGHLLSRKTGKPISATTLSSALSDIKRKPTPTSKRIEDEIRVITTLRPSI